MECLCDNIRVVVVVNSGRSQDRCMHLLQCLFLCCPFLRAYSSTHIPGIINNAVNTMSHSDLPSWFPVGSSRSSQPASAHSSTACRPVEKTTKLDPTSLGPTVLQLLQAGLDPSTQCAYALGKKHLTFSKLMGYVSSIACDRT